VFVKRLASSRPESNLLAVRGPTLPLDGPTSCSGPTLSHSTSFPICEVVGTLSSNCGQYKALNDTAFSKEEVRHRKNRWRKRIDAIYYSRPDDEQADSLLSICGACGCFEVILNTELEEL
jgi:hypothetical protein